METIVQVVQLITVAGFIGWMVSIVIKDLFERYNIWKGE